MKLILLHRTLCRLFFRNTGPCGECECNIVISKAVLFRPLWWALQWLINVLYAMPEIFILTHHWDASQDAQFGVKLYRHTRLNWLTILPYHWQRNCMGMFGIDLICIKYRMQEHDLARIRSQLQGTSQRTLLDEANLRRGKAYAIV